MMIRVGEVGGKSRNRGKSRWPPSLDMTKKLPAMHMRDVEGGGGEERERESERGKKDTEK
jgi:hypothetical protein